MLFPCSSSKACSDTDLFKTFLETGRVSVDHHKQAYGFLVVLAYIISQAFNALKDEAGASVRFRALDVDTMKVMLQDRSEEPFLLDIFTQQSTAQLLRHPKLLPGR